MRPSHRNVASRASINMKGKQKPTAEQEPMGIVISRGPRIEKAPTFSAYMWARILKPTTRE